MTTSAGRGGRLFLVGAAHAWGLVPAPTWGSSACPRSPVLDCPCPNVFADRARGPARRPPDDVARFLGVMLEVLVCARSPVLDCPCPNVFADRARGPARRPPGDVARFLGVMLEVLACARSPALDCPCPHVFGDRARGPARRLPDDVARFLGDARGTGLCSVAGARLPLPERLCR